MRLLFLSGLGSKVRMQVSVVAALSLGLAGCATVSVPTQTWQIQRTPDAVSFAKAGSPMAASYQLLAPTNTALTVESAGFFHPLTTPKGVVVTDLAPADHKHHRGAFLGWVEMDGETKADFWGWGEHAPIKGRRIVNRSAETSVGKNGEVVLHAVNEWRADSQVLIEEHLKSTFKTVGTANVLDVEYTLQPKASITLVQWAFGGFCVRTRKDAEIEFQSPEGVVTYADPSHLKPETDWPDYPYYAAGLKFADGSRAGVAVINHPSNPLTVWHNNRGAHMINPCVVASGPMKLTPAKALVLRYRVVTFDGPTPDEELAQLTHDFTHKK